MKRTAEWWARLNERERRRLTYLESVQYGIPPCISCGRFREHVDAGPFCDHCRDELAALIAKGDGTDA